MKPFSTIFLTAILSVGVLALNPPPAEAGRVGGSVSGYAVVPARGSTYFEVPYLGGEPAVVTAVGSQGLYLELLMFDADGHVAVGTGFGDRKAVSMDVYRAGVLRIEVRNPAPVANIVLMNTN